MEGEFGAAVDQKAETFLVRNIAGPIRPPGRPLRSPHGHVRGREGLATRSTFLLLRGSAVTERLRVAGNADWQEKRVPRCWPSVNGGTSGLECGVGNLLPSTAKSSTLGSRSGPPSTPAKVQLGAT
jgi:hypothetical protein